MKSFSSRRRLAPLRLQQLESRENPAGKLATSVVAGVLTISGTDQAEKFTITQLAGNLFTITGSDGTTIDNGTSKTTIIPATSIKMILNGGADGVTFDNTVPLNLPGSLYINAGNGNNSVSLANDGQAISIGALTVFGGRGTDQILLGNSTPGTASTSQITGGALISLGDGDSSVVLTDTKIGGDLSIRSTVGTDNVQLSALDVGKNVFLDLGQGESGFQTDRATKIGGSLQYFSQTGKDTIGLRDTTIAGLGGASFLTGSGDVSFGTFGFVDISRGNLSVTSSNGLTNFFLSDTNITDDTTLNVKGALRLTNQNLTIEDLVNNHNSINLGSLNVISNVQLNIIADNNWTIAGGAQLNATGLSGGVDARFKNLNVSGNIIGSSSGINSLSISSGIIGSVNLVSRAQSAILTQDDGSGSLQIKNSVYVNGYLSGVVSYQSSNSNQTNGSISINSGFGSVRFQHLNGDMTLLGKLTLTGKTSSEVIFASPSDTGATITGEIFTFGGLSTKVVLAAKKLTLQGKVTVNSPLAATVTDDYSDVQADLGGVVDLNKDLVINSTSGNAVLNLKGSGNTTLGGKLNIFGRKGATVSLSNTGLDSRITGDIKISSAETTVFEVLNGGKRLSGNILVNGRTSVVTVGTSLSRSTFAKNLTILGDTDSSFSINTGATISGDTIFKSTSGTNSVSLNGNNDRIEFAGNLSIETGSGNDTISFLETHVNGNLSLLSSGGTDDISLGGMSEFTGTVMLDTGADDDTLSIGITTGLGVPAVLFSSKATMLTGLGDDTVKLGLHGNSGGDANSIPFFNVVGSKLDAGLGLDTIDPTSLKLPIPNLTVLGF